VKLAAVDPDAVLDKAVRYLEGPLNRRVERVMKSRLVLTPIGLGLSLWAYSSPATFWRSARRLPRRLRRQK
jgi:hypothetical protein